MSDKNPQWDESEPFVRERHCARPECPVDEDTTDSYGHPSCPTCRKSLT